MLTRRAWCMALGGALVLNNALGADMATRWIELKAEIRARHPKVRHVTVPELQAWLADTARAAPLLIDTRSAAEYADGRLLGAVHAPSVGAVQALLERLPQHRQVVLYCSVGYRSSALAQRLQNRLQGPNAPELLNLEGSVFEWANLGLAMEDGRGPTRQTHPYDSRWGDYLDRKHWSRTP